MHGSSSPAPSYLVRFMAWNQWHSKTMMAAFIIAIKGTIKQAVMLGLAATISHTAVVWLIAFGGMVISKRFTAQSAEPWLQLISAVIIIGTAFWMFWRTGAANATGWRICTSTSTSMIMSIITITNMASIRMPMHEPMPMTLKDDLMVERSPTGKFCYLA